MEQKFKNVSKQAEKEQSEKSKVEMDMISKVHC